MPLTRPTVASAPLTSGALEAVTPPAPTSEAVAAGGSVTSWTFGAFSDPDSRIDSYSATLTAVVGSGSLSGSGLGPYSITGTADGDSYTVELDALDSDGAVLATATHSVAIAAATNTPTAGTFVSTGYIQLDGVDESVTFGNPAALLPTTGGTWSVSFWCLTVGDYNSFYSVRSPTNSNDIIDIYEGGFARRLQVDLKLGGLTLSKVKSNVLSQTYWNHVLVTCDGSDFRAWVNGSEITSWNSISGAYPTTTETWDGTEQAAVGGWLYYRTEGSIANVAVWSTDQAANVAAIYALDRTGDMQTLGTPPDLLYVPFKVYGDSETTAGGISDLSGNNYDGTGVNLDGDELQSVSYAGDSA